MSTEPWSGDLVVGVEAQRRALLSKDELLKRRLWRDERVKGLLLHKSAAESK
ncbi:hypothetical protein [Candidimonas sp. SYP-B2681]|uniref:hypothetical protein n=1 Tax=Candidimonas sp. SYP-B2681 TaxID=2497686 RepID=UPI0013158CCF|nr:hypothetical protein [Candidimonas sp. SYP-B2681]